MFQNYVVGDFVVDIPHKISQYDLNISTMQNLLLKYTFDMLAVLYYISLYALRI